MSFARYEAIEHERLGRIEEAPSLRARPWRSLVTRLDEIALAPTRWATMHAAFARGLEAVATAGDAAPFARPWAESFARAEARSNVELEPESMLADWAADVIWSLEWALTPEKDWLRSRLESWVPAELEPARLARWWC